MRNRIFLIFLLTFLLVGLLNARPRKSRTDEPESLTSVLEGLSHTSPAVWPQGMPFAFLSAKAGLNLIPEEPDAVADTLPRYGSVWHYDSMVSEEDWMGRQLLQLRFLSPDGRAYRYSTGRPFDSMADTTFIPALVSLYPLGLIQRTDSLLRARTFYILYNDDRVFYEDDSLSSVHPKFVPVVIDSVGMGNELAPLCVYFSTGNVRGHFYTSLPESRQVATSTVITRFLSASDPSLTYPNITPEVWAKIKLSQVVVDMTAEEVRLAWGRPSRIESVPSRNGLIEMWFYSNNRVLQMWDGRLNKIGIL